MPFSFSMGIYRLQGARLVSRCRLFLNKQKSSRKWGYLGQSKNKFKKNYYSKKIFKLIKKYQNFLIFQGLIYEINLIALGSLKIYKATQMLFLMCQIIIFHILNMRLLLFLRKIVIMLTMMLKLFFFFRKILISVSGHFPPFFFFFFGETLISFTCFFSGIFFVFFDNSSLSFSYIEKKVIERYFFTIFFICLKINFKI